MTIMLLQNRTNHKLLRHKMPMFYSAILYFYGEDHDINTCKWSEKGRVQKNLQQTQCLLNT